MTTTMVPKHSMRIAAIALTVMVALSGCAGRGTEPDFPLYVSCVQEPR